MAGLTGPELAAKAHIGATVKDLKRKIEEHRKEIRKLENTIAVLMEIASDETAFRPPTKRQPEHEGQSLPDTIIDILDEMKKWMTAGQVHDELKNRAYHSESEKFRMLVNNTMHKMYHKGRLAWKKEGSRRLFATPEVAKGGGAMTDAGNGKQPSTN